MKLQRAKGEIERDVLIVQRALGRIVGGNEADVKNVFVGADFGNTRQGGIQSDAQQLRHTAPLHLLKVALMRNEMVLLAALTQQFEYDVQGVADRQHGRQPALEIIAPQRGILMQPVMVGRQVEFAGSAGNASALLDTHQPFVVAQVLAYLAA